MTDDAPTGNAAGLAARISDRSRVARLSRQLARHAFDAVDRRIFPEAFEAGDQWQRVAMNEAVQSFLASLPLSELSAAEISGDAYRDLGWADHRSLNFPQFDLLDPVPSGLDFDVVVCEQVLEHVDDPFRASRHLFDLCRPGGRVVITSPFMIKVHELPMFAMLDYWRFTPRGLRVLLERAGFVVEEVDGWGNRMCVAGNLSRWSAFRRWHPMSNEDDIPVQIWAFGHRPE